MILAAFLAGIVVGALVGCLVGVVVMATFAAIRRPPASEPAPAPAPEPEPLCGARAEAHECVQPLGHPTTQPHRCVCGFVWRGLPLTGLERVRDAISRDRGDHAGPTKPITWGRF